MKDRLTIEVVYEIGEIVYITTDEDQRRWQVVAYKVYSNELLYEVYGPGRSYVAYDFELSRDKQL